MVATLGPAIWKRMMDLDGVILSPDAARNLLTFDFSIQDQRRMADLSERVSEGTLSAAERAELEEYVRVNHLLSLIHSKARLSLARAART